MRFRIQTVSPLPDLKAWFSTHSLGPSATIADLKSDICSQVQSLKNARIHGNDIALVLDDFDLLDESLDVVRDGDLICIRLLPGKNSTKRKTLHSDSTSPTLKRAKGAHLGEQKSLTRTNNTCLQNTQRAPSLETSSQSSSESESSESTSDSDADSSSSLSSSPPRSQSAKILPFVRSVASKAITTPFVPPGEGKNTTHSRNIRRRIKRQYQRNGGPTAVPPTGSSAANTQPLGVKRTDDMTRAVINDETTAPNLKTTVMMSSLRNKNKKKGFKNSMANPLPPKITFNWTEEKTKSDSSTALPPVTTSASSAPGDVALSFPHLIPPSEKQNNHALPSNIFVTVVDVEEGLSSKRKRKPRWEGYCAGDVIDEGNSWLDYGAESVADGATTMLDFEVAEKQWESFSEVTAPSQLKSGMVVGWKALAINPSTFTPEMLLNLATVVSQCGKEVVVRPLPRPGAAQVQFGGSLEEVADVDDESWEWPDVVSSHWRVVSNCA